MTERESLFKDKSSAVIYLCCSKRKGKITAALSRHFNLIDPNRNPRKGPPVLRAFIRAMRTYLALRKLREDDHPLMVMVDSPTPAHIAMGMIAKSLHLPFFVRLRGGMWREVEDKWQLKPFPIKQLYSTYYHFCRRRILSLADGIITVSYFLKNQIICNTDIDLGKIMPVYNPINFAAFDETQKGNFRKNLKISEHDKIILTVTNFNYYKKYMGITYYLSAILQVLQENRNWYFVIVGGGYSFERARKSILEMVQEDIREQIVLTGYYEPIEEAFVDADVVLHLAFRETAPNVVLEAQAARKPVLVNHFGGTAELLQNRYDQPSCVIKEVSELYQSLTTLVKSEQLRKSIGQKNRQAVTEKFTYDNIGNDFCRCINLILDRKVRSR